MTDFTSYTNDELTALIMTLFTDATTALKDGDGNVTAEPIFKTGIGFDTESTQIDHIDENGKIVIDDCFCYSYQISMGAEHFAIYRNIEQFTNFMTVLIDTLTYINSNAETPAKCLIWVANLSHEFSFIRYHLMREFECKKLFAKSARDVLYINFGVVEFRECIGLFGRSLADIAKNWTTTQKLTGDMDYSLIRHEMTPLTDAERAYCINDVIILGEMHDAVLKAYTQDNGALILPYTSAGFVRLKLKNAIRADETITDARNAYNLKVTPKREKKTNVEYMKMENRHIFVDAAQWMLCRNYGYSGGLCGSNIEYVGKNLKNVQCADLTSDYPAQMLHCKYPRGWLKEYKLRRYDEFVKSGRPYFILALVDMTSYTNHATFSKHKVINHVNDLFKREYGDVRELIVYNGKILKAKNCLVVLNDIDIDAYNMIYKMKITPLKLWAFDGYAKLPTWLTDSVIDDYVTKAVLKHENKSKTQEYKDAKRNVNTYYGVLSTRQQDAFDVFINSGEDAGTFTNSKTKSFKQQCADTWLNPYIAFWVTSYARRILMAFISRFPEYIVQYDTDSLYYLPNPDIDAALHAYNKAVTKKNEKLFANNPNKTLLMDLGTWDFDELYDQFLPLGAKKYIKQHGDTIETVIAGLPKSAIPTEIKTKNIKKPLSHYNVVKYVTTECTKPEIIIKHMFTHKFASAYNDGDFEYYKEITDYLGNTHKQLCGCYHGLVPIDFTLSMGVDYLKHILNIQKREC